MAQGNLNHSHPFPSASSILPVPRSAHFPFKVYSIHPPLLHPWPLPGPPPLPSLVCTSVVLSSLLSHPHFPLGFFPTWPETSKLQLLSAYRTLIIWAWQIFLNLSHTEISHYTLTGACTCVSLFLSRLTWRISFPRASSQMSLSCPFVGNLGEEVCRPSLQESSECLFPQHILKTPMKACW